MNNNKKMKEKVFIKYILQGFVVAIAAYYIPLIYKTSLRKPTINEILFISLTAAFTMFLLDKQLNYVKKV